MSIYFFYKYVKIISYKNTQVVQINTYVWKKFFPINVYFNSKHQFSSSSFLILLKSLQIYLFPASTSQLPLSRGERRYILEPIKFITSFHVEKKKERFISDEGKGNNNNVHGGERIFLYNVNSFDRGYWLRINGTCRRFRAPYERYWTGSTSSSLIRIVVLA